MSIISSIIFFSLSSFYYSVASFIRDDCVLHIHSYSNTNYKFPPIYQSILHVIPILISTGEEPSRQIGSSSGSPLYSSRLPNPRSISSLTLQSGTIKCIIISLILNNLSEQSAIQDVRQFLTTSGLSEDEHATFFVHLLNTSHISLENIDNEKFVTNVFILFHQDKNEIATISYLHIFHWHAILPQVNISFKELITIAHKHTKHQGVKFNQEVLVTSYRLELDYESIHNLRNRDSYDLAWSQYYLGVRFYMQLGLLSKALNLTFSSNSTILYNTPGLYVVLTWGTICAYDKLLMYK